MIVVGREALLQELESVSPGLSPKGVTEQSQCFVFDAGRVMSFNDELACSTKTSLGKKFTGAVTAAPLLALLGKMTEDEITVEARDGQFRIKGKGRRQAGVTMEHEVKLAFSEIGEPETEWRDLPTEYPEALSMAGECASDDRNEYRANCVRLARKAVEATDNYQIGRYRIDGGFAEPVLIRKSSARCLADMEVNKVAEGKSWLHFEAGKGLRIACRVARNEDYPDLKSMFVEGGTKAKLPKGLKEAAERAAVFFEGEDKGNVRVTLADGRLRMRTLTSSLGFYDESRKIDYAGEPLEFVVSAKLLAEIGEKYNECRITEDRLIVDGGRFKFLTCLQKPKE